MKLEVAGDGGQKLTLEVLTKRSWGDWQLGCNVELRWATIQIEGDCSAERLDAFSQEMRAMVGGKLERAQIINEDGGIDIAFQSTVRGNIGITGILIPDMISEDRIEFSFDGEIMLFFET